MKKIHIVTCTFLIVVNVLAQSYNWPCPPFTEQHWINGTFCENRISDSDPRDHFHDGVDIHWPLGNNVYAVIDGTVDGIGTASQYGINSYVRVGRYAYVHVDPNPALSIGDPVITGETILGTTNSWNHIHFKDGWPGSEINPLRNGAGLTPFVDPYKPSIDNVEFYVNGTMTQFENNRVYGAVEIVAQARDKSDDGPIGDNNGIYSIGYQIYDASGTTPLGSAIQNFEFYQIPASDSYIKNVYFSGSDQSTYRYTITNHISADGAWNTDLLERGTYQVRVFTEDTRLNTTEVWKTVRVVPPDYAPPAIPQLKYLYGDNTNQWILAWFPNDSSDVAGYDLSFTLDGKIWTVQTSVSNSIEAEDTVLVYQSYPNNTLTYFRLNAYDNSAFTNYSDSSDVYGFILSTDGPQILIVDGFDRTDGYWQKPSHRFVMRYGTLLAELGLAFNTCSDDAVRRGEHVLNDYAIVIYLLGDESGNQKVLSANEQSIIKTYLQNGGKLIISGSEIGYDLVVNGTSEDRQFFQNYLKSSFIADSASSRDLIGESGSVFDNFSAQIHPPVDQIYKSDILSPLGSQVMIRFADGSCAGIYFHGLFENGNTEGDLAYFSFPIELITDDDQRSGLLGRVLGLFGAVSTIENHQNQSIAYKFILYQNHPNPFNPTTTINYQLYMATEVEISIYTLFGQKVATLVKEKQSAGYHHFEWNASGFASGIYLYRLTTTDGFSDTKKLLLLK